jgi:hypothetical protein
LAQEAISQSGTCRAIQKHKGPVVTECLSDGSVKILGTEHHSIIEENA